MNTEIIGRFSSRKVIVIGDIMLDKYVCGTVNRISPEAPVQIVDVKKEDYVLGGAANTANNIAALGASVVLVGIIGDDEPGRLVSALLRGKKITNELIKSSSKPTIQKIRIMAQNQQLLRIDYETKEDVDPKTEAALLKNIKSHDADMIIISDYMKGTITKNLAKEIPKLGKLVVVDPKSRGEGFYSKVTLMTPNNKEVCAMFKSEPTNSDKIIEYGKKLVALVDSNVLVTRGDKGSTLFEKDGSITDIPTKAKEVFDVSGAGDTVTAAAALAIASGASLKEAAEIANHAAGVVVGKVGTATCTIEELKNSYQNE